MKLPFLTKSKSLQSGAQAEAYVTNYLGSKGLSIISRNYRCRRGEIDIIAQHGEVLIFVEVRLRNDNRFASGAESVDFKKQQRLITTASHYLQQHFANLPPPCRFDVVSLSASLDNRHPYHVEWLQDAFRPEF